MNRLAPVITLVIKELFALLRDKKGRMILVVPPLIQLFIIAHAATLEVKNISVGYVNHDAGHEGHELMERVKGSPYFTHVYPASNEQALRDYLDIQKVIAGIYIPPDFSRNILSEKPSELGITLDGRRSNSAQIVQGYLLQIINDFSQDRYEHPESSKRASVTTDFRSWFNPELDYILYTVPCLIGILSMILGLMVTALSVAREREMGTFDQLLVSPLNTGQILAGKMIPALIIGVLESTLIMVLAIIIYDIPFRGSLVAFYLSMIVFITSIIGIGLFISAVSQTQQQAILGTFVFMVPTMLLSGFATPVENMPIWLQPISWLIPISHFFVIIKGVFLKNMGAWDVWQSTWPMALIALGTLGMAAWMFQRRLE